MFNKNLKSALKRILIKLIKGIKIDFLLNYYYFNILKEVAIFKIVGINKIYI